MSLSAVILVSIVKTNIARYFDLDSNALGKPPCAVEIS